MTIIFPQSPLCGEKALVIEKRFGIHCDLSLELRDGSRVCVDAIWTDFAFPERNRLTQVKHLMDVHRALQVCDLIDQIRAREVPVEAEENLLDQSR